MLAARGGHVVEHRRGDGAEIDHVQPRRGQAAHQRGHQARAGEPSVAPDRHRALAGGDGFAAEGAAELLGKVLIDGLADHAADVVGLEDARVDLHGLASDENRGIVGRPALDPSLIVIILGAALADSDSGMCLGSLGGAGTINLEVAAAANTEVVRSKRKAIKSLNLRDEIEDILISLGRQYHVIRPLRARPGVFYYVAVDRAKANLAMARMAIADTEIGCKALGVHPLKTVKRNEGQRDVTLRFPFRLSGNELPAYRGDARAALEAMDDVAAPTRRAGPARARTAAAPRAA